MSATKAAIIDRLQKDILSLQGFKTSGRQDAVKIGLGAINQAFPNGCFPVGAVHEFISNNMEEATATTGFVSGIISSLMLDKAASVWICKNQSIFPPALKAFSIDPGKIIFVKIKNDKDILWATEEALKCTGLAAVITQLPELSFTESRRLQLAVEHSHVTGFILRHKPKKINTTACVTRWNISPLSSTIIDGLPGVGFPRWKVELQKVRNGKPGCWELEFVAGRFRQAATLNIVHSQQKKKVG